SRRSISNWSQSGETLHWFGVVGILTVESTKGQDGERVYSIAETRRPRRWIFSVNHEPFFWVMARYTCKCDGLDTRARRRISFQAFAGKLSASSSIERADVEHHAASLWESASRPGFRGRPVKLSPAPIRLAENSMLPHIAARVRNHSAERHSIASIHQYY